MYTRLATHARCDRIGPALTPHSPMLAKARAKADALAEAAKAKASDLDERHGLTDKAAAAKAGAMAKAGSAVETARAKAESMIGGGRDKEARLAAWQLLHASNTPAEPAKEELAGASATAAPMVAADETAGGAADEVGAAAEPTTRLGKARAKADALAEAAKAKVSDLDEKHGLTDKAAAAKAGAMAKAGSAVETVRAKAGSIKSSVVGGAAGGAAASIPEGTPPESSAQQDLTQSAAQPQAETDPVAQAEEQPTVS
jgi:hypothetical protein